MNRTGYEVDPKLRNEFSPSDYTGNTIPITKNMRISSKQWI